MTKLSDPAGSAIACMLQYEENTTEAEQAAIFLLDAEHQKLGGPLMCRSVTQISNLSKSLLVLLRGYELFGSSIYSTKCYSIQLGINGDRWAILMLATHLTLDIYSTRGLFAVPVALNTPDAECLRRVWVLDKGDNSLLGKGYLIGLML